MNIKYLKKNNVSSGFTLIELIIVVALMLIILIAVYNFFFVSKKSYDSLKEQSLVNMEMQGVISILDQEIKQAKKATKDENAIVQLSSGRGVIIYTDLNDDGRPEKIRYRVKNKKLYKSYANIRNNKYPYEYRNFGKEKVILENIKNDDIFTEISLVESNNTMYNAQKDYRCKIKIHFVLENPNESKEKLEIDSYLLTKSRVEAD